QSVMITRGEHGLWLLEGASSTAAEAPRAGTGSVAASLREPAAGVTTPGAAAAIAPTPLSTSSQSDVLVERNLAAVARDVADVTGAGDTVIATVAMSFAAGAGLVNAAALANHAAGISVAKFGPAAVTHEELLAAVDAASGDIRPPA